MIRILPLFYDNLMYTWENVSTLQKKVKCDIVIVYVEKKKGCKYNE